MQLFLRRINEKRGALILLFSGVGLPLWLFGALAEDVVEKEPMWFDARVLEFVHQWTSAALDSFMLATTTSGSALVLVPFNLFVFAVLYVRKRHDEALFWIASVTGAALMNAACKVAFARVRPALWITRVHETTYSFPSGHAMQSMAVATALLILGWRTRWRALMLALAALWVGLVGLSRVYFGVHYPSDILAGWTASLAWVSGLNLLLKFHQRRYDHSHPT